MRYGLLFSGQGLQHAAMLPWLADDALGGRIRTKLGTGWRARLDDPAWANSNAVAQPLLTGLALAAWRDISARLPPPSAVAGYSVGEIPAFSAAGVVDADMALDLAVQRASLMDAAASAETGLLALSGLAASGIENLCGEHGLEIAIRVSAERAIVGGPREALACAALAAQASGGKATPLKVAVASHTSWMRTAAEAFERLLETVPFQRPAPALIAGFGGARVSAGPVMKHALARQIDHTVHWSECMDAMAECGVQAVLEVGAGRALASMWNERHQSVPARAADEFRSADAAARWVVKACG